MDGPGARHGEGPDRVGRGSGVGSRSDGRGDDTRVTTVVSDCRRLTVVSGQGGHRGRPGAGRTSAATHTGHWTLLIGDFDLRDHRTGYSTVRPRTGARVTSLSLYHTLSRLNCLCVCLAGARIYTLQPRKRQSPMVIPLCTAPGGGVHTVTVSQQRECVSACGVADQLMKIDRSSCARRLRRSSLRSLSVWLQSRILAAPVQESRRAHRTLSKSHASAARKRLHAS